MISRLACTAVLLSISIHAASQDIDDADDVPFHDVFVFLETPQEQMLGPDAMRANPGDHDYVDVYGIGGLIHGIRTLSHRTDDQLVADALQSAVGQFDFDSSTKNILAAVEVESNWVAWGTEERESVYQLRGSATRVFRETPVDHALGFSATYFVSPDLDRVRLIAVVRLLARNEKSRTPRALFTRTYEYLSPSVGAVLRPFRDGEKAALAATIEEEYERLAGGDPDNATRYANDKAQVLERLAKRNVIPPGQAIRESWPNGSMARELRKARRHIEHMMTEDLRVLRGPGPEAGERVKFEGLDEDGDPDTMSGYRIGTLDGNTIYRDKKRNYYSVP